MGRVYAVASAKGGVGKTTTTANLGAALVDAGSSVVVVDADLGMPNLGGALGVDGGPTIHDALAGEADAAAVVHEGAGGVAVVPGSADIDDFRAADPAGLEGVVAALADEYDYVLLDSGAGLNHDSLVPLSVADSVVLVTGTGRDARGDTAKTREVADRLGTPVAGVVVARGDGDADGDEGLDDRPLLAAVPESPAVAAATEAGEPVVLSDPDDPAAAAYREAATTLTDRESAAAPVGTTDKGVVADADSVAEEADGDDNEAQPDVDATVDETAEAADESSEGAGDADAAEVVDAAADETEADDGATADEVKTDEGASEADGAAESETGTDGEAVDDIVEEAEGETDAGDGSTNADADEESSVGNDGVHETALFGDDSDEAGEFVDEAEDDADASEEDEKKGFFRRLFGLD